MGSGPVDHAVDGDRISESLTQDSALSVSDDLPARLAFAVGRLNRRLRPSQPALSHGLLMALSTVVRCGPLRPGALAKAEGLAAPSATRLVVELEARGLVSRSDDPDDGRSFLVEATEAGLSAILEARAERARHAVAILAGLDGAERATVAAALGALEKAAGVGSV